MTEIGKEVRRRLKLVPAKAVVVKDWYYTYVCRSCEKENTEIAVVKAPREPNFIPGGLCHAGGRGTAHGAEACHGPSPVPAGTGAETTGHSSVAADYVQLAAGPMPGGNSTRL